MGKKLLVADDSVTIQKVIKLALSSEGYDILAVSDGKEAIRAIEEELPDVVLIDVALPIQDACEIKRQINSNPLLSQVGFILLASAFEKIDEKKVGEVKFDGRLIKPFDPSHLRKAVSELLQKKISGSVVTPPPPVKEAEQSSKFSVDILNEENSSYDLKIPTHADSSEDLPSITSALPILEEAEVSQTTQEFQKIQGTPLSALEEKNTVLTNEPVKSFDEIKITEPIDLEDEVEIEEEASSPGLENDIKDLTESTIKMSGLDDFNWSLDDSKKLKSSDAPPALELDVGNEPIEKTIRLKRSELAGAGAAETKIIDDGGSTFPLQDLKHTSKSAASGIPGAPPSGRNLVSGASAKPQTPPPRPTSVQPASEQIVTGISRAELEELIRKDLESAIEKLAKETVPRIAESIIRKEIDKILSEP